VCAWKRDAAHEFGYETAGSYERTVDAWFKRTLGIAFKSRYARESTVADVDRLDASRKP
jgi:hypothetical protein